MDKKWETTGTGNSVFHSSRKERYEEGHIQEKVEKKGFFKKNPSYKIVLIDLILIVVLSGVIVPFIMKREGLSKIDNYKLIFRAFDYDEEVLLTLKISEVDDLESKGLVEARFYFEEDSSESFESDLLPSNLDERIIKSSIVSSSEKYAFCEVVINNKKRIIKKRIQ